MMKKSCRNALKEALDIYESAALEYRLAADVCHSRRLYGCVPDSYVADFARDAEQL